MAEIVVGLLGLAIELGKCIAEPVKRQLNYLCCLNSNVQNLKRESKKLDDARVGLQRRVTSAKNNAEVIAPEVETWLEDVNEIQEKMTAIDSEITNIQSSSGCLRVKSRYSLSKKVKKTTEAMKQLQGSCNFDVLSQPTPPAAMVSTPFVPMNEFESRKHIEEEIMRHLRDDNINMIGICGMGGVGKTTMAKKVMKRAREEHLFVEIVIAVVSQQVDMLKIQKEIAESLGLKLEGQFLSSGAPKLRTRLSGGKRILIVLDDVWKKLNLEELGIPCESGSKECTILLTSRDRGVFDAMDVQKVCGIQTLSKEEAWSVFREKAGTCVDDQNLLPISQKIAEECKGLPLALVTLGVALKNKTENSIWEDALQQLENYNPVNIPNFPADVYTPLKLSYDFLDSRQARSIFLLCCLFPEDHNIPLEDLTVYAMGLGMFEDAKKLGQARNRTCSLIDMLKSRFLLLEGSDEYHVKMHDVVRDVSIFIASEERQINCNDCTWISPFLGERIGLSIESKFPNLRLLLTNNKAAEEELQNNDLFFKGLIELKVLSIESCDSLRSLPHTTQLLKNLRTLILDGCKSLESISVVGELLSLEILICRRCHSVQDLPVEMGRLTHLKLIEFSDCVSLEAIAPGVISRMVELEELKMVDSFDKWEEEVNEGNKRKNAGLRELESLTNLIRLEIEVADYSLVAKQIHLSPKIVKFDIAFGNVEYKPYYRTKGFHKKLHLGLRGEISLGDWINVQLLRNTEYLHSEGDGSNKLDLAKAQNMRLLCLRDCSTMKKLVNITTLMETTTVAFPLLESLALDCLPKLEGTCNTNGPDQGSSNSAFPNLKELTLKRLPALKHLWKLVCQNVVSNLSSIEIYECDSLHNLFLLATAKDCLFQLESLTVVGCKMMEQVVLWNREENKKDTIESHFHITFPKLKRLKLHDLPNLTVFYKRMGSIGFPLLTEMEIKECPNLKSLVSAACSIESGNNQYNSGGIRHDHDDDDSLHLFCGPEKVTFGGLEILYLNGYSNALALWCHQIPVQFFAGLKDLKIEGCGSIRSLFSSSQAQNLVNLQKLNIGHCKEMIKVIEDKKEEKHAFGGETTCLFPNLKSLYLYSLTELKSFCEWECALKLESLEEVDITDCPKMERFSLGSLTIPNLKGTGVDDVTSLAQDLNGMPQQQYLFRIEASSNSALWKPASQNVVSNLSSLEICECDSLHNLFLLATAKDCLFQLESLTVTGCEKMEEVLLWNQEDNQKDNVESRFHITFPKLKRLKLCDLPNLTAFYKGMGSIEFPLLTEMEIKECPNLKSLVSATCSIESGNNQYNSGGIRHDHDDDDSLYFFCGPEKGSSNSAFQNLKNLRLMWLPALKHLWKPVCQNVVSNLSSVEIYECDSLHNLFLLATAKDCLFQLESLTVTRCEKMEQVLLWNQEDNQTDTVESRFHITFPKLKRLELGDLPNLTAFYKGMGSIEFPLLTEMEITNCPNLKSLVSATCSIECGNNQYKSGGIRHDHDDDDSLYFFCGLKKVASGSLETLSLGGYSTTSTLWCHQIPDEFFTGLGDIMIENCGSIRSLFSSSIAKNLLNLRKLRIKNCCEMVKVIEEDGEEKDACGSETTRLFPNLKILHLECLSKLKTFCEWRYALELPSLEEVKIKDCPEMERYSSGSLTTPPLKKIHIENAGIVNTIHLNDVPQVEELEFRSCRTMEQVVVLSLNEEENKRDIGQSRRHITFLKLKRLSLWNLPNLTTFCKGVESIEFPLLTRIEITDCTKLKSFVPTTCSSGCENNQNNFGGISHDEDDVDPSHLFCNPKVVFGSLKELHIKKYNSSTLWCDQIPIKFFSGLKELEVVDCGNIRSLFSSLIARNLVNLQHLSVKNCHEIIKVIEEEEEEKDACGGETSLFPNLDWLSLWGLPKLKSFCHWECALKLESLKRVHINDCPQMERFSLGFVTTPNLESIFINRKNIFKTKDLNGTLQQQYLFIVEKEEEEKKKQEEREKQEREEKEEEEREEKGEDRKDD